MDFFDRFSQDAKKAGDFLAEKATDVKNYTVATWNAADIRNKIEATYKAIGLAVYQGRTAGKDTSDEIERCIEQLATLEEELKIKEQEKQAVKNKKICPSCGKPVAKDSAFCPYCGASVE